MIVQEFEDANWEAFKPLHKISQTLCYFFSNWVCRYSSPVGAVGCDGLCRVGCGCDPGLEGDLAVIWSLRVSGAIQPFVALKDNLRNRVRQVCVLQLSYPAW
jgi:hypothetical protein